MLNRLLERPRPHPRLVVLRALGLGDALTAVPALRALAAAFPEHERVLVGPEAVASLLRLAGPLVDRVVDHRGLGELPSGLHGPEVAVNLHGRGPQSTALLRGLAPGRLIAFGDRVAWRAEEHEADRWCRLLDAHGIAADPTALRLDAPPVSRSPAPGATVVHPGAASPARRWPAGRFAAVAAARAAAGQRVVVTGGEAERELAEQVARAAALGDDAVLAGRTDLLGLAALVAHARVLVCGDTGVAHLATAFGTPSVLLFGPTPPTAWGPRIDRDRHHVLWAGRPGDPHGQTPDPGLLELTVEAVLAELARI